MAFDEGLDEAQLATEEEFETDPFGCAAAIIRAACHVALSYAGAMNNTELSMLKSIKELVS